MREKGTSLNSDSLAPKAVRKNNFSNGAGAITDRTLEKQAFLIIPEGVAEVIFAHRLSRLHQAFTCVSPRLAALETVDISDVPFSLSRFCLPALVRRTRLPSRAPPAPHGSRPPGRAIKKGRSKP